MFSETVHSLDSIDDDETDETALVEEETVTPPFTPVITNRSVLPISVPDLQVDPQSRLVANDTPVALLQPGDILLFDYRELASPESFDTTLPVRDRVMIPHPLHQSLTLCQFNIERGYELEKVIDLLSSHQFHVGALQELDIGCHRTNQVDCAQRIAQALKVCLAFIVEFVELDDHLDTSFPTFVQAEEWDKVAGQRHVSTQAGSPCLNRSVHHAQYRNGNSRRRRARDAGGGVHGNALFSVYPFTALGALRHTPAFDWARDGSRRGEPRLGARYALWADLSLTRTIPIRIYSLHLEPFTGIEARVRQFFDVLQHLQKEETPMRRIVAGDLNTLSHGLARLSTAHSRDRLRFASWGYSEAAYWVRHILQRHAPDLIDPFDCNCETLRQYGGVYRGKLDWLLLDGLQVTQQGMLNMDYQCSDHRLLWVAVEQWHMDGLKTRWHPRTQSWLNRRRLHRRWGTGVLMMMALVALIVSWLVRQFLIFTYKSY